MHRIWFSFLPILILAGCSSGTAPLRASADQPSAQGKEMTTITILSTNDFHGRYTPFAAGPADATSQANDPGGETPYEFGRSGRVGGFSWLAAAVDKVRRGRGADTVLLVHAGDTFSDDLLGNLTQGEAMIRLMNALGYDFMAFGNHDFDYGIDRTRELAKIARFPMRGANVVEIESGSPLLGEPFIIREIGGVKVALLALGYHNTEWTTNPDNISGLRFTSGIEAARRYVPDLRSRADVVVVLSHQGAKVDRLLAREVEGIDLIIGGHSHDLIASEQAAEGCPIVQALSDGAVLGETVIQVENGKVVRVAGRNHMLWNDGEPDPGMAARIQELRAPYRSRLEEILTEAVEPIPRQYKSESPFDVWIGERLIEETGAEIAILPGIGYGISIQKGPVTRELLYTLLPHEVKLVTLKLTGNQIREILEQCAVNLKPEDLMETVGGLVQTAGLRWTLDLARPIGERIRDIRVKDAPIQPDRLYSVATHSGMLAGIHRYDTFKQGTDIRRMQRQVNELIEEKMNTMKDIKAPELGQITVLR